jgi:hypothetical protein
LPNKLTDGYERIAAVRSHYLLGLVPANRRPTFSLFHWESDFFLFISKDMRFQH